MNITELAIYKKMFGGGGSVAPVEVTCGGENVTTDTPIESLLNVNLYLPIATSVSFTEYSGLISVHAPNLTQVEAHAFQNCYDLTTVKAPNLVSIGTSSFANCRELTTIDLTNVTSIEREAFSGCWALTKLDLPKNTTIGERAFDYCTALTSINLPNAESVDAAAFYGCTSFDTLILSNTDTVCNMIVTAILNTKIATAEGMPTGEGFIYVPTKFYEDYVANLAEQASALTGDYATAEYIVRAILRKIEDYPEICEVAQ